MNTCLPLRFSQFFRFSISLTLLVLLLAACQAKGPDRRPAVASNGDVVGWQPEAVSLRIYPSTRFISEKNTPMLEARIELFDQMSDSIKASGQLRFELFAEGNAPGVEVGRLLYSWDIGLMGLAEQQRYYDPITRAYLFRLRLDETSITRRQVLLRVTFQASDDARLSDEQPVRLVW